MILDQPNSDNPLMYDLSFIYTKQCDLACSFCMYRSGPSVRDGINLTQLEMWLTSVDMSRIASFGVYGGEVSVAYEGFGACLDLVSYLGKPQFVLTNGSWSRDFGKTTEFLKFCNKYRLFVVVSGTAEHRRYQNREVLESLAEAQPNAFRLKPLEENFHAMGRLEGAIPFSCSGKCIWWNRALRIAVQPDGAVIFQNCDGVYPIVGHIYETFAEIDARITSARRDGFGSLCPHWSMRGALAMTPAERAKVERELKEASKACEEKP